MQWRCMKAPLPPHCHLKSFAPGGPITSGDVAVRAGVHGSRCKEPFPYKRQRFLNVTTRAGAICLSTTTNFFDSNRAVGAFLSPGGQGCSPFLGGIECPSGSRSMAGPFMSHPSKRACSVKSVSQSQVKSSHPMHEFSHLWNILFLFVM